MNRICPWAVFTVAFVLTASLAAPVRAQVITKLLVEIKTGDKTFAGTDDPVHLLLGGKDFTLDNPGHDDFERNHTDAFELPVSDPDFTADMVRAVGRITISKTGDSFFGGGWYFAGIKVRINDPASEPIFADGAINKWLDGDHREWHSELGDPGWNLPEPPPFPPCKADPVILFKKQAAKAADNGDPGLDSDCDGIPDDVDTTFDPDQPDQDGDGLPDRFETQNGTDPTKADTDGDGWLDGGNVRDILLLTKVECIDEDGTVEIGSDEIYFAAENVRFPLSPTLDNHWEMDDHMKVEPFVIVDNRTPRAGNAAPAYKTRSKLREADFTFMEKPFDDTFESFTLDWTRNDTREMDFQGGSRHYRMAFKSITTTFMDPSPTDPQGDHDQDMLPDSLEFLISAQSAQLFDTVPVPGYDGLATPLRRNLFVEVDATDSDADMPFDAKQQVSSQFYYHEISMHLDDGFLHGGELLQYDEEVDFSELGMYRDMHQRPERFSFFKYALFVPSMGGQHNGRADRPGKKLMVSRSTMIGSFSAIVFIHELGHTLGLCHPIGTSEPPSPSPSCPTPSTWHGNCQTCCFSSITVNGVTTPLPLNCCSHYCGVDDGDVTAMGDDIGVEEIVIGGAIGIMVGLAIIALFIPGAGWLVGAALLAAAALLGAIGGFFFSDAYQRVVDYHVNEWAAILLNAL
jgi:PLAT/LH2 domain-containing protein/thrombospondin type 3 repeat protein